MLHLRTSFKILIPKNISLARLFSCCVGMAKHILAMFLRCKMKIVVSLILSSVLH